MQFSHFSLLFVDGCGFSAYRGDGFCDDENNNAACDFDGGDCCGDNVNMAVCTKCQCLESKYV